MYKLEIIIDQYTIFGVDVLIKEHQFPDSDEINYHAYFRTGAKYNMIRHETLNGLRKAVTVAIHQYEFDKKNKFSQLPY
jgi:hypothetical protein